MQFWTHENHALELYQPEMIEIIFMIIQEGPKSWKNGKIIGIQVQETMLG